MIDLTNNCDIPYVILCVSAKKCVSGAQYHNNVSSVRNLPTSLTAHLPMNILYLFDSAVRCGFAAGSRSRTQDEHPLPDGADVDEFEYGRRSWLLILISLLLATGFAAVFFLGSAANAPSRLHEVRLAEGAAVATVADEHLTLGMMLAPGTTVSKRVAGVPGAVAGDVLMTLPPREPLAELAHQLSPEWELAVRTVAIDAVTAPPQVAGAEQNAAQTGARAQAARVPAPEIFARLEGMKVAEVHVENGIGVRVFRPSAALAEIDRARLSDELGACREQGFIAGESCRARVCNGIWGKVPECPFRDTISH